jgi:hypothetical protein
MRATTAFKQRASFMKVFSALRSSSVPWCFVPKWNSFDLRPRYPDRRRK